ncbi:MAG: hypothetical protein EOO34_00660 [Cyanobacteriota bacterium]|nr:MAG: hypothetical protein EOO34_00660 [Cyanobacteriota bacterium]
MGLTKALLLSAPKKLPSVCEFYNVRVVCSNFIIMKKEINFHGCNKKTRSIRSSFKSKIS